MIIWIFFWIWELVENLTWGLMERKVVSCMCKDARGYCLQILYQLTRDAIGINQSLHSFGLQAFATPLNFHNLIREISEGFPIWDTV